MRGQVQAPLKKPLWLLAITPPQQGDNAIAIGTSSSAMRLGVAMGGNTVAGISGVAIGHNASTADGIAMGFASLSSGSRSVAIGPAARTAFNNSVALGADTLVTRNDQIVIGNTTNTYTLLGV